MTWQCKTAYLGCASVQHMEQNSFALFHADGISVMQHPAIDCERVVAHLVSVWHTLREGSLHGRLALLFKLFNLGWRQEVLGHVSTAAESRLEFLQNEEDLAVIIARLMLGFDIDGANLAAILPGVKIRLSSIVRVIETKSCGTWSEYDPAFPACRNKWRALLSSSIDVNGHHLAVPMQLFWHIRVVEHIHSSLLALLEAK